MKTFPVIALVIGITFWLMTLGLADAATIHVRVFSSSSDVKIKGAANSHGVSGTGRIHYSGSDVMVTEHPDDDDIQLTIPENANLEVTSGSGDITIRQFKGSLTLKSVSGDISVKPVQSVMRVRTISGSVNIDQITGGPLQVKTVSGDIRLKGSLTDLKVSSVSGNISLEGFSRGEIKTTSGEISLLGTMNKGHHATVHTHSGSIKAALRTLAGLKYSLESYSGTLGIKFGKKEATTTNGRMVSGTYGDGKATLDLTTFSGNIRLEVK